MTGFGLVHGAVDEAWASLRRLRESSGTPSGFQAGVCAFVGAAEEVLGLLHAALPETPAGGAWWRERWRAVSATPVGAFFGRSRSFAVRGGTVTTPGRSMAGFLEAPIDASALYRDVPPAADTPPGPPMHMRTATRVDRPVASEWWFEEWEGVDALGLCEEYLRLLEGLVAEAQRVFETPAPVP